MIGERHGVIGVNCILGAREREKARSTGTSIISTHRKLIGIDSVGIGFDFFAFIYRQWPESRQKELAENLQRHTSFLT